jgi:uncharacterized membrane protein required for colicin V production
MQILKEAVVVGIATIAVGTIVGFIVGKYFSVDLPEECKKWNKNHVMEICLFFTGFFLHILCEYTGINKWYCTNGNACQ